MCTPNIGITVCNCGGMGLHSFLPVYVKDMNCRNNDRYCLGVLYETALLFSTEKHYTLLFLF